MKKEKKKQSTGNLNTTIEFYFSICELKFVNWLGENQSTDGKMAHVLFLYIILPRWLCGLFFLSRHTGEEPTPTA